MSTNSDIRAGNKALSDGALQALGGKNENTGQPWWETFDFGSALGGAASVIDSIQGNSDTQVANYYQTTGGANNNNDDKDESDNTLLYVGIGVAVLIFGAMAFAMIKK